MRDTAKKILFFFVYIFGLHLIIKRFQRRRVLILMYHGLVDSQTSLEWTQLPLKSFERQMKYISKNLKPIILADAVEYISGAKDVAPNPVVVTFDDGYESNFGHGYKILAKYNIPATVFVASSFINDNNIASEPLWFDLVSEIIAGLPSGNLNLANLGLGDYNIHSYADRARAASEICDKLKRLGPTEKGRILSLLKSRFGSYRKRHDSHLGANWARIIEAFPRITIGAHTVNHEILSTLPADTARREIAESKKIIETTIGSPVVYFAYPNGGREDFTYENARMAGEAGFKAALTAIEAFNDKGDDLFTLRRIGVGSDSDMIWFKMAVTGTIDFLKKMGL